MGACFSPVDRSRDQFRGAGSIAETNRAVGAAIAVVRCIPWLSLTMTSTRSRFQRSHESRSISHDAQDATNGWITDIPAHITVSLLSIHLSSQRHLMSSRFTKSGLLECIS